MKNEQTQPAWHRAVYMIGRVLRSWMISLGVAFFSFCLIALIPGALEMPARYVIILVLLIGTLATGAVHDVWGRSD